MVMYIERISLLDEKIEIPIPENYHDCFLLIKSDMYRLYGFQPSLFKILIKLFYRPYSSAAYLAWYRLSQPVGNKYIRKILRAIHRRVGNYCKIDLPWTVKAGWGLYLGHGMCMVINGGTIIGNNVNLSQFVNIGTNHQTPAIIGDNVYIAPSVCIVENVQVGSNATIGAGAVVIRDVPSNATVAGVPAKILSYKNPGRYTQNNKWEFKNGIVRKEL